MRNKFLFTAGLIGTMMTVGLRASNVDAGTECAKEFYPYVMLRGGYLFGKRDVSIDCEGVPMSESTRSGSAWSGSGEIGFSCCNDRVFVGLEAGYFTGKFKSYKEVFDAPKPVPGEAYDFTSFSLGDNGIDRFFIACNVTLRKYWGEKTFLQGGVGAGGVRSEFKFFGSVDADDDDEGWELDENFRVWRFPGQTFAGVGVSLNENLELTAGWRLRWMPGKSVRKWEDESCECTCTLKQEIVHGAEVGIVWRW